MKISKRQLKRIIREEYTRLRKSGLLNEWGWGHGGGSSSGGYSPDESFYEYVTDAANEAARIANTIDGPKGRAAKKLYTDMIKDRVAEEKADGVDPKKMRQVINDTWRQVYR